MSIPLYRSLRVLYDIYDLLLYCFYIASLSFKSHSNVVII